MVGSLDLQGVQICTTLRILGMSWGVNNPCFEAPGMSLGGSGVSIGGVRILRASDDLDSFFTKLGNLEINTKKVPFWEFSTCKYTLQGTKISPKKWHFEDDFSFSQGGIC